MGRLVALGILALLSSTFAETTSDPQYPCYPPPYSDLQRSSETATTCGDGQIKGTIPKSNIPDALKNLEFHEMPVPGGCFFITTQPDVEIQPPPILVKPTPSGPITPPPIFVRPPPMSPINPPSMIVRPPPLAPIIPPPITVRFPFTPTCPTQISDSTLSNPVFPFTLNHSALSNQPSTIPVQSSVYTKVESPEFGSAMYDLLKAATSAPYKSSLYPGSPVRSSRSFPSSDSSPCSCTNPSYSTSNPSS